MGGIMKVDISANTEKFKPADESGISPLVPSDESTPVEKGKIRPLVPPNRGVRRTKSAKGLRDFRIAPSYEQQSRPEFRANLRMCHGVDNTLASRSSNVDTSPNRTAVTKNTSE
jgi:hypothetical protein